MTWVRLDDQFFRHAKARAAGKDGRALYLAALCFASANLTDGIIRSIDLPLLAAEAEVKPSTARRLVDAGLWHVVEGGWRIHDWEHRNPSADEVKERREKEREKKQRYRRGGGGRYVSPGDRRRDNGRDTPRDGPRDTVGDDPGDSLGPSDQPTPITTSNKSSSTHVALAAPAMTTTICEAIADQRIARLANPPANPSGYRRKVVADVAASHGQAIATIVAERPELEPAAIVAIVEPQAPPSPLDRSAAAQRQRDEILAARARGEACPACDGCGVVDAGDGTFVHCEACR